MEAATSANSTTHDQHQESDELRPPEEEETPSPEKQKLASTKPIPRQAEYEKVT